MGTLRDQILAARELPRRRVDTPEWAPFGVPFVHVRGFTVAEAEQYGEISTNGQDGKPVANSRIITMLCATQIVDEVGERIFTDDDADSLKDMPVSVVNRIVGAILEQSGSGTNGENPSKGDQEEPSSSDSPSLSESQTRTI